MRFVHCCMHISQSTHNHLGTRWLCIKHESLHCGRVQGHRLYLLLIHYHSETPLGQLQPELSQKKKLSTHSAVYIKSILGNFQIYCRGKLQLQHPLTAMTRHASNIPERCFFGLIMSTRSGPPWSTFVTYIFLFICIGNLVFSCLLLNQIFLEQ